MHTAVRAAPRSRNDADGNNPANVATIATATTNSVNVKPPIRLDIVAPPIPLWLSILAKRQQRKSVVNRR